MKIRRILASGAAVVMAATGMSLVSAAPASAAFTCRVESSIKKVCYNGFSSGQWTGSTQLIKVSSTYNYDAYFRVEAVGGGRDLVCFPAGGSRTYDRGTRQVGTTLVGGKLGWGFPAPC